MKNIIVLLDGTLNSAMKMSATDDVSNVFKMNNFISRENGIYKYPQFTFYFSGVGSDGIWNKKIGWISQFRSKFQAAFSSGLEQQIVEAYVSICANYSKGDRIYLIGFSRGAVAAKIVSEMINEFGILIPRFIFQFSRLWDIFQNEKSQVSSKSFSQRHCIKDVSVEYLGLFDAVLGWTSRSGDGLKARATSDLAPCVKRCLHIISIDEDRLPFKNINIRNNTPNRLLNIWVPGHHSDIGGVYKDSTISNISLITMLWDMKYYTNIKIYNRLFSNLMKITCSEISRSDTKIFREAGFIWSILGRGRRHKDDSDMGYIHPVIDYLYESDISINNRLSLYNPDDNFINKMKYFPLHEKIRTRLEKSQDIDQVPRGFPRAVREVMPPMGPGESSVFAR